MPGNTEPGPSAAGPSAALNAPSGGSLTGTRPAGPPQPDLVRQALDEHLLEVWFQPKIGISNGRVAGVEALLRHRAPGRGIQPPQEILEAAEAEGLMGEITLYVLEAAITQCARWREVGLQIPVAVNVTPTDLANDLLPVLVADLLARHNLAGDVLTLEITENAMLRDPTRSAEVMHGLRQQGVRLSADDFGVGYSSVARLVQLPLNELKVDLGLVLGMHASPHGVATVRAVIDLGHALGLTVVAEGVEDERTLRELRDCGCDLAQGYHYSRPVPPDALAAWVRSRDARRRRRPVVGRSTRAERIATVLASAGDSVGPWALAGCAAVLAVYLGWQRFRWGDPSAWPVIGDLAFLPFNLVAAAAAVLAARTMHPGLGARQAWLWLAAALAMYAVGDVIQLGYEYRSSQPMPFPSWADLFYLAFYPLALVALLRFPTPRRPLPERIRTGLDVAIVALCGGAVVWYVYLAPTAIQEVASLLELATAIAYPVGDLVLVLGVVSALVRGPRGASRRPLRLLVVGFALYLVTDLWSGLSDLSSADYQGGDYIDIGWVVALIMIGLAGVIQFRDGRPTRRYPLKPLPDRPDGIRGLRPAALVVGYGLLLYSARHTSFYPLGGMVITATTLSVLMVAREYVFRRDHGHLVRRFELLAVTDDLTGLYNRRHLLELAAAAFDSAALRERRLSVLIVNVDHFRRINDRYGHQTGDLVLRAVGEACRSRLRSTDIVGRYSGDELMAVLPDTAADDATALAGRLRDRLRSLLLDAGIGPVPASLSIGVAELGDAPTLEVLLARADEALGCAKQAGRDCIRAA